MSTFVTLEGISPPRVVQPGAPVPLPATADAWFDSMVLPSNPSRAPVSSAGQTRLQPRAQARVLATLAILRGETTVDEVAAYAGVPSTHVLAWQERVQQVNRSRLRR